MALIPEGATWGRMRLVKSEFVDRPPVDISPGVREFVTDVRYTIRCECGNEVKVWSHQFPGKRRLRDCGKCGLAKFDEFGTPLTIHLPDRLWKKVRVYAEEEGINFSKAITRLVEGKEGEWNWRTWKGKTELPEECWKYGVRVKEYKVKATVTIPRKLRDQLEAARVLYGQDISRIVVGLVSRALEGPHKLAREVIGRPMRFGAGVGVDEQELEGAVVERVEQETKLGS